MWLVFKINNFIYRLIKSIIFQAVENLDAGTYMVGMGFWDNPNFSQNFCIFTFGIILEIRIGKN